MSLHEIEIEYGERYTDFVMGMYVDTRLADDIDEIGWNLCDCDDAKFQEKIGNCRIISSSKRNGILDFSIEFPGQICNIQELIVDEFLDNWEELLQKSYKGIFARC